MNSSDKNSHVLGEGLYSQKDVFHISGAPEFSLRDWIRGDLRNEEFGRNRMNPIIHLTYPKIKNKYYLNFIELVEVLAIDSFRREGLSIQAIRRAHEIAEKEFKSKHPFALNRFFTDGREIWVKVNDELGEEKLMVLISRQYGLKSIVEKFLHAVEFTAKGDSPTKYWPVERNGCIVIDPRRNFGHPILAKQGIPTIVLAKQVVAEKSFDSVAKWYDVPVKAVKAAYEYELHTTKRLAA